MHSPGAMASFVAQKRALARSGLGLGITQDPGGKSAIRTPAGATAAPLLHTGSTGTPAALHAIPAVFPARTVASARPASHWAHRPSGGQYWSNWQSAASAQGSREPIARCSAERLSTLPVAQSKGAASSGGVTPPTGASVKHMHVDHRC